MGLGKYIAAGVLALGIGSTQQSCILAPITGPIIGKIIVGRHFGSLEKYEKEQAGQSDLETRVEQKHGLRILGRHTEEDVKAMDAVFDRLPRKVVEPIENVYVIREEKLLGSPFASAEAHPENMSICIRQRWIDDILVHEAMHVYHFQLLKDADPKAAYSLPGLACSDKGCELIESEHADDDKTVPDIKRDAAQCEFEKEWFAIKKKHVKEEPRKDFHTGNWKDGYPGPRDLYARPYGSANKMEDVATHGEAIYNLCYNKAYAKGKRVSVWARLYPAEQKEGYAALIDTLHKHGFLSDDDHAYAVRNICSDYEKYKQFLNKDQYFYMWENPWGNKLERQKHK
jgi:hypothetical protein